MGTNFYWIGEGDERDRHIGKRSYAGLFCWDCNETLCHLGQGGLHHSRYPEDWSKVCLRCGLSENKDWQFDTKPLVERPKGVRGAACFLWAVEPETAGVRLREKESVAEPIVEDEYGTLCTAAEFLRTLRLCPIQFTDSIGLVFS